MRIFGWQFKGGRGYLGGSLRVDGREYGDIFVALLGVALPSILTSIVVAAGWPEPKKTSSITSTTIVENTREYDTIQFNIAHNLCP